ncbi:MAG: aminodeoxychorismate synthase, component I, partial [Candidatus Margulisbacteria bacterium]|nr:aminodeoxychorismate synthase, component I [Candidatus Margulisiibacteriota bacterium]
MSSAKIVLDFNGQTRYFTNPLKVISCNKLSQVQGVLAQAENYQKKGYWVVGFISYEAGYAFEKYNNVKK